MANLTERQQQIQERMKAGMSPPQIAKDLGVSANAVYQQLARMRKRGGNKRSRPAAATRPEPQPQPQANANPTTPLQAIRLRRSEIEREVKECEAAVASARRQLDEAQATLSRLHERHNGELKALERAENVLATDWRERHESATKRKAASANSNQGKSKAAVAA